MINKEQKDVLVSSKGNGLGFKPMTFIFKSNYFEEDDVITLDENYFIHITSNPVKVKTGYKYTGQLITGNKDLFVPKEQLIKGTNWYKNWSTVEQTLAKRP